SNSIGTFLKLSFHSHSVDVNYSYKHKFILL
ncbi:unnamed protein product, partial [marine sediment metagenome]